MTRQNNTWRNSEAGGPARPAKTGFLPFSIFENVLASGVLILLALLPLLEAAARSILSTSIPYTAEYVRHLVLWLCFAGAMITSREGRHLGLTYSSDLLKAPWKNWIDGLTSLLSVAISSALVWASLSFAFLGFSADQAVGFAPLRVLALIMPFAFSVITVRFIVASGRGIGRSLIGVAGLALGLLLSWNPLVSALRIFAEELALYASLSGFLDALAYSVGPAVARTNQLFFWPLLILLLLSIAGGTPIFVILGGTAFLLFLRAEGALEVLPNEAYTIMTSPLIPAIPLFTLAGYILSESGAGKRLVRLFRALFGWLPGGLALVSILVCAFLTTFTGGSGVTILAVGGLLSFVLIQSRYRRNFSLGLLTSAGSIGLLFPPSLPIIMYGVVGRVNIKELFLGGILPGSLMIAALAVLAVKNALASGVERVPFRTKEVLPALRESFWELLLPVVVLASFFTGFTTLVETSALAVVYILIVEVGIHRDIKISRLYMVFLKAVPIIGGVLIILAMAKGVSFFIVDAQIPLALVEWFQSHIQSKYVFLILLNLVLLLTGCLMDIFSAILIVAPLIIPLGNAYGVHPVHLGIIFLANLELGYLTPPVGINLFLASYRFNEPLLKIYRNILPFLLVLLVAVLLITYVPWLTTVLPTWLSPG
jgi:tripartite ATP-independent transporter DctM subunit